MIATLLTPTIGFGFAGRAKCLRPGGPVECLPVASATGGGFKGIPKAQRADTMPSVEWKDHVVSGDRVIRIVELNGIAY
ncbi:hypothetical protein CKO51_12570 [Rhodopirellula sp. SM50]|nr:hypothetical protein CKO51_12570 [Rhodopirellula sp. SM50]